MLAEARVWWSAIEGRLIWTRRMRGVDDRSDPMRSDPMRCDAMRVKTTYAGGGELEPWIESVNSEEVEDLFREHVRVRLAQSLEIVMTVPSAAVQRVKVAMDVRLQALLYICGVGVAVKVWGRCDLSLFWGDLIGNMWRKDADP